MKSHDAAVVEMLRDDPDMALDYLRTAFDELDEEGGESAFLMALRNVVEAQGGMAAVAERAKVSRESLYRALSPRGNPTLRTMTAVIKATGIHFHDLTHQAP
ncbi:addiction module antidote protein [Halomonas urumqiensis]|uniref:Putative addiction module antidote protein n=1 Tax=Halomonas urumqiensis TaxID=1684789 RepID=A0A2N7UMU3_9GAMM|nr:addiction module antidote protein [Halomonas urumqiensis]PMR81748.1 putative addiction module antidote protein [Halomonas urumqiensis]PTB02385.1 putative addiction module antidote protein [Halomonas urumqiensis]GHE21868.1 DNA-binding prophage protein [Halomonas urumqiensis]